MLLILLIGRGIAKSVECPHLPRARGQRLVQRAKAFLPSGWSPKSNQISSQLTAAARSAACEFNERFFDVIYRSRAEARAAACCRRKGLQRSYPHSGTSHSRGTRGR